jgi:hypothetical protein
MQDKDFLDRGGKQIKNDSGRRAERSESQHWKRRRTCAAQEDGEDGMLVDVGGMDDVGGRRRDHGAGANESAGSWPLREVTKPPHRIDRRLEEPVVGDVFISTF